VNISAIVVTKGGYDLSPVLAPLRCDEVIVWDNSLRPDRKVYGRYLAIAEARNDVVYVQDDDCIVQAEDLIGQYDRDVIVCNVPRDRRNAYRDGVTLVGWGAVFHRSMADFSRYLKAYPEDELFWRECDRVFTYLHPHREVEVGVHQLPYAFGNDRMGTEPRHGGDLKEIRRRLYSLP
jgi:hypothetical protein